jgi:hypothetical protein
VLNGLLLFGFKEGLRAGSCVLEFFTCSAMMFYFLLRLVALMQQGRRTKNKTISIRRHRTTQA